MKRMQFFFYPVFFSQEPQSFYRSVSNREIGRGHILASQCIFTTLPTTLDDLKKDKVSVPQGLTSKMEMCDYFVYYNIDIHKKLLRENSCTTPVNFTLVDNTYPALPKISLLSTNDYRNP